WTYDPVGNRTSETSVPSGTLVPCGVSNVSTCYTYDAADELVSSVNAGANIPCGMATVSACYTYDLDGNRTSVVDSSGTTTYAYDANNALTQTQTPSTNIDYTYSGLQDLRSVTTDSDQVNQIVDRTAGLPVVVGRVDSSTGNFVGTYLWGNSLLGQDLNDGTGIQLFIRDA